LTVDLEQCRVYDDHGLSMDFQVEESRRYNLLNGLDDIALTLQHADRIAAYEAAHGLTAH
jgi:3-isopropylmalate/(R)-2-methylmalate dehydratase small subunit